MISVSGNASHKPHETLEAHIAAVEDLLCTAVKAGKPFDCRTWQSANMDLADVLAATFSLHTPASALSTCICSLELALACLPTIRRIDVRVNPASKLSTGRAAARYQALSPEHRLYRYASFLTLSQRVAAGRRGHDFRCGHSF